MSGSKPVAQTIVLRRVLMGGISTNSGRCVVVSFSSTNPTWWWFWNGGRGDVVVFVFGTLLGPEATGPGFWPWVLFVSGFPAMTVHARVCGVCGVGLLFENYIVDASILYKKQFPRI